MDSLKRITTLAALALLLGLTTSANALSISPCATDTIDCKGIFDSSASNPTAEIDNIEAAFGLSPTSGLTLLYKNDEGSGELDNAPFDPYYTTTYDSADPEGATISWDAGPAGPSIQCPECYLYVKDGNKENPNIYMFDLGSVLTVSDIALWNGTEDLVLSGFWPGPGGAISHVAIYGTSVVPVPAAVWLFGTALLGFIGFSRRTQV